MIAALFAFQVAATLGAALLVSTSRMRNALAALLLGLVFGVALAAPATLLEQALLCFVAAVGAMKVLQIAMHPAQWPPWLRIWHVLDPVDVRQAKRVRPAFDASAAGRGVLYGIVGGLAIAGLAAAAGWPEAVRPIARILLAAAMAYGLAEAASWLVVALHRAFGIAVPPIHDAPILSRSLAEFWSARWNLVVSGWLREVVFRPLARRSALVALAAAFATSALLHAWLAVPLGVNAAATVGAYFIVQGAAVLAERRMSVRSWPGPAARAWTVVMLLGPLPLLAEPFLGALGL